MSVLDPFYIKMWRARRFFANGVLFCSTDKVYHLGTTNLEYITQPCNDNFIYRF